MRQAAGGAKIRYRIGGMACGFRVASIPKAIGRAGKGWELKSADEARKAAERAEVVFERPGVVVNMPFLGRPGAWR